MGRPSAPPSPSGSQDGRCGSPERRPTPLMAPDTPFADRGQTPARPDSSNASPAPSSVGVGTPSPPRTGEFQGSLRRMTNNLMEIFDQMSSRAAVTPTNAATINRRGDSVSTITDLEAGETKPTAVAGPDISAVPVPTAPAGPGAATAEAEAMNPTQMRRLTTSIVDVLRQLQASGVAAQAGKEEDPEVVVARHLHALGRDDGMLPDNVSELSLDDKLSLISGGTSTSGKESYASLSSHTALLKGWGGLKSDEDYKGDVVHPWYIDLATGQPAMSRIPRGAERRTPRGEGEEEDHLEEEDEEEEEEEDYGIPSILVKQRKFNIWGTFVAVFYLAAFFFYVAIRIKYTLGLGSLIWYGAVMLGVEILGALAQFPYAVCLLMRVVNNKPPAPDEKGVVRTLAPYHIRVFIPCYKEPLDVIAKTVMAALFAAVPANCQRTVYLLDDGRDAEKRKFMHSLRVPNVVYVSGRKRAKGEMNGKSANINNCAKQLYPGDGAAIPLTEVICVFDADQVPNADFYLKMVPMLDGGRDVGMVLSPQTFYNLNPEGDVFNHANVHFWDYTQPGYDALGLISCTGTNFLVRARSFADAGWFPEWTLTEDFALGIEMKRRQWQCRYVQEYLAIGEAPDEVRNCFQQRSRWSKGHFQTFFSKHNPLFQRGLNPLMRWMYGSVILAYFSAFLGVPLLMIVPMVTVWFGAFPIVINFWAAVCITVFYGATILLNFYTHSIAHIKSMWFTGVANSILWFAFLKAMYRSTIGRFIDGNIVFKVTAKGLQRVGALPLRDVWMAAVFFITMLVTLIFGLVHYAKGPSSTPLVISLIFMALNLIPNYLLLQYALFRRPAFFNIVCRIMMFLMTFFTIFGIALVWALYPRSYNYTSALQSSITFMDSQRVGALPENYPISWRGSALTQEAQSVIWVAYNNTVNSATGQPLASSSSALSSGLTNNLVVNSPGATEGSTAPTTAPGSTTTTAAPSTATLTPSADYVAATASPANGGSGSTASSPSSSTTEDSTGDPFATIGGAGRRRLRQSDPFANLVWPPAAPGSSSPSPGGSSPSNLWGFPPPSSINGGGNVVPQAVKLGANWDLEGGFITGMAAGNFKATLPIAFTTTLMSWAYQTYGDAIIDADSQTPLLDNIKWGADYLMKTVQSTSNTTYILSRIGDIATEELMWYRLEEYTGDRPAYVVDMGKGASDLGGQVAAALASASIVFNAAGETDYASSLLTKAKSVYDIASTELGHYSVQDWNMSTIYNSSTFYDDLAWASSWLFKATQDTQYLSNMYTQYVNHLEYESAVSDFKYAFDWDNVFWPTNVLLAQETGGVTFQSQSEQFLKSWICSDLAANYTLKGRAFNPMSAPLGSTMNTAFAALAYADSLGEPGSSKVFEYQCWGLSQIRYALGDSGRSLVVGYGKNPPKRTQDRDSACPANPEVCNRVTGLLSPDPDTHVLEGALVYGTADSDNFIDNRDSTSAYVGIENNAGLIGALAGASKLKSGLWEQCLQQYGIYRRSDICGSYVNV